MSEFGTRVSRSARCAALAAVAAIACASTQVDFRFDPDEDFSTLRRFTWIPAKSTLEQEEARRFPELHRATRGLIEEKLAAKGYTKTARAEADFLVVHHLSLEHKLETQMLNGALSGSEWEVTSARWRRARPRDFL